MPPGNDESDAFDVEKFYGVSDPRLLAIDHLADLLKQPVIASGDYEEEYPEAITDVNATLVAFVNALRSKEAIRRTAFKIPFVLSDKTTIGVSG